MGLTPYSDGSMAKSQLVSLLLAAKTFSLAGPSCLTPKNVISIPWDFCPRFLLLLKTNTPKSALTVCWQCYRVLMCLSAIDRVINRDNVSGTGCGGGRTVLVNLSSRFSGDKHFWASWLLFYLLDFSGCNKLGNLPVLLWPGWSWGITPIFQSPGPCLQSWRTASQRDTEVDWVSHTTGFINVLHLLVATVLLYSRNKAPAYRLEHKIHVNF